MTKKNYSLMIHGGAGALDNIASEQESEKYLSSLKQTLEQGRIVLESGGTAVDAVEACATLLEDDPLFNAGRGSVLNEDGHVEMDAAVMNGIDLSAGGVAAIHNIANPLQLARLVMEKSEHVLLIKSGAQRFAKRHGVKEVPDHYFVTEHRFKQFQKASQTGQIILDHESADPDNKFGTIGVAAYDLHGNLAAGTSTGGIVNQGSGRVGDSPISGSGVYADNAKCAVSATGYGEDFMRTVLAKTASDLIEFQELNAQHAPAKAIQYLTDKVKGRGGIILIDYNGFCSAGFTTKRMIHGWIEHGGETHCSF
jgi:beta-aspartyl-peptidase (threonine type)